MLDGHHGVPYDNVARGSYLETGNITGCVPPTLETRLQVKVSCWLYPRYGLFHVSSHAYGEYIPILDQQFLGSKYVGAKHASTSHIMRLLCFLKTICFFPICWPTSAGASIILICSFCGLEPANLRIDQTSCIIQVPFFNRKHPYCHQVKSSYVSWINESEKSQLVWSPKPCGSWINPTLLCRQHGKHFVWGWFSTLFVCFQVRFIKLSTVKVTPPQVLRHVDRLSSSASGSAMWAPLLLLAENLEKEAP